MMFMIPIPTTSERDRGVCRRQDGEQAVIDENVESSCAWLVMEKSSVVPLTPWRCSRSAVISACVSLIWPDVATLTLIERTVLAVTK